MRIGLKLSALFLILCSGVMVYGSTPTGDAYLRQPDVHGDSVVFVAESDLWVVSAGGGISRRLTTHAGGEYFPSFSPDGSDIAFTGAYGGNRDVYIVSSRGGEPKRLTWHPGSEEVIGWMPDGNQIIFRSTAFDPHNSAHLFTVDLEGGEPVELPLSWAARLDVDRSSGSWAFNRQSRDSRTWKRYRGGRATDIWVGHPDRADFTKVTDFEGQDAFPMWHGGRIYFLSDQGGTGNIWSVKADGSDRMRHTEFENWDVRWPANGPDGRIVFTVAADIHLFDPADGTSKKIDVDVPSDRVMTRIRYPDPGRSTSWFDLSPEGDRLALLTRGELFSVAVKDGVTLPVTRGTGARERTVTFDPKGEKLLYITDAAKEEELRVMDAWGRDTAKVVKPAGKRGFHYAPLYSPDGAWIAYADDSFGLFVLPSAGGGSIEVDRSTRSEITEYSWSPDGRWLAYSKTLPSRYNSIFIYDTTEKKTRAVTGPSTEDRYPAWDPDGRYLYFVSQRATNPFIGNTDFNNIELKNGKLYMVLLREDVENPLAGLEGLPPDDEDEKGGEEGGETENGESENGEKDGDDEESGDEKDADAPEPVKIDIDGLPGRIVELPVDRGNYADLQATQSHLFFVSLPIKGMAEQPGIFQEAGPEASLMFFDLEKKKADTFVDGISGYIVAGKGGKMALMKMPGEIYVVDTSAAPGAALAESMVDLSNVVIELDPRDEWSQIFHEAWRNTRDFYWDEKMSGLDWDEVRDRYAALLPRLASRSDLTDLIGQLIGEMNTSHTYVFGGDPGVDVPYVPTGLLGAEVRREGNAFRVETIFRADPADRVRSPLEEPEVGVHEGQYILAVNRRTFDDGRPLHAHLENLAGREVLLTVNDSPTMDGAREVVVTPMSSETELRYSHWVRENREYVSRKTGGKIGYIHLPDMWTGGLVEFNTWFYPQLDREGMVVDVRWNGGGAVSQLILERLRRPLLSNNLARGGRVNTYPYRVLNGPFVVLVNESSGSDGDIFPQAVQLEGLAPVIGARTWGGVVGISAFRRTVDGGMITQPQSAWWDYRDGWDLENRGVIPDIEIQNMPQDLARGTDAQLDRAIDEVLRLHKEEPPKSPDFGPIRDRSRDGFKKELND